MRAVADQREAGVGNLRRMVETERIAGNRCCHFDRAEHPAHGFLDLGSQRARR